MKHLDWFAVDVQKRAAVVRSRDIGVVMKELLANGLDAGASQIALSCKVVAGTRRDGTGMRAFHVECSDDGNGCDAPDILRRVGSSTSDLHAETRGRFGQGLIDVLAISTSSEIRALRHRLLFDSGGCQISGVKESLSGLLMNAIIRHGGEGLDTLDDYFGSMIIPDGIDVRFNGRRVEHRQAQRVILSVNLQTVAFDPRTDRVRKYRRSTPVEIHARYGDCPMIYELGIPVDQAPWSLPFDINVMQKTPLDTERNMLPGKYKAHLISELVAPMSDVYTAYMDEHDDAPPEVRDDRENATRLTDEAQQVLIETITGARRERIVRRNPFDPDDMSESQELEHKGFAPIRRGSLPAGVSELLENTPSVAETHDLKCKATFQPTLNFPPVTERQALCMAAFAEIGSALTGRRITCDRSCGGSVAAAYRDGVITLNIKVDYIWTEPLGEQTLGVIIHECAHERVSGHAVALEEEIRRLGGRLARWVGNNHKRWTELEAALHQSATAEPDDGENRVKMQGDGLLPIPVAGHAS